MISCQGGGGSGDRAGGKNPQTSTPPPGQTAEEATCKVLFSIEDDLQTTALKAYRMQAECGMSEDEVLESLSKGRSIKMN